MNKLIAILFLLYWSNFTNAQKTSLIIITDQSSLEQGKNDYKKSFNSPQEAQKEIKRFYLKLIDQGYLGASIDSIKQASGETTAYIHVGLIYYWGYIKQGNVEEVAINAIGFREKIWRNKKINQKEVSELMDKLLVYYENNGYPFSTVKLDSLRLEKNNFCAVLNAEKNKLYKIDSIIIKGDLVLTPDYIYNHISVKPGDAYNESLLKKIDIRLKEIPFVQVVRPSEIVFTENQALLFIYLSKRKSSSFNGILGILPDAKTGKITLTGDARINLKNSFGKGEVIDFNWRKLNTAIQDLKINFNYPFLFKTNFGTDVNFKLYKRDSTFLELNNNLGIQYLLRGGNYFKVFYTRNNSTLLTPEMFANSTTLPSFADVTTSLYGLGLKTEKTDYRINPRKGFNLFAEASAGTKKIKKNPKVNPELYDEVLLSSLQIQATILAELFIPLSKRSVFRLASNNGYVYNENLFVNELIRLGGLKSIRGFNEESILASFHSIESFEYRFILEQNSALFVFFDYAYYERNIPGNYFSDRPFGFGAGINFSTGAGIFSMNYALGSEQGNAILLRGSKVHFGFVSYF